MDITARLSNNTYLALGFGQSMADTSMILWQANGMNSAQNQLYSSKSGEVPAFVDNEWSTSF